MIQLKKKKIIFLGVAILIIIAALLLLFKNISKQKGDVETPTETSSNQLITRPMTNEEKDRVGISLDVNAEVVNDRDGMFIYKINN